MDQFSNKKEKKGTFPAKKNKVGQKVGGKIEYKGRKLTNFQKKKIKGLFGPKKQFGAELKKKKSIFWAKNWGKNSV